MLLWTFEVYVAPNNKSDVQKEIDRYNERDLEFFRREIVHLAITPKEQWYPTVKKLKNEDPLYEIRYKANKRQTRALGYFADRAGLFIITNICYHKGTVYEPPGAFKTAHTRLKQIQDSIACSVPLEVDGEVISTDGG
jgi:hypothetical protein